MFQQLALDHQLDGRTRFDLEGRIKGVSVRILRHIFIVAPGFVVKYNCRVLKKAFFCFNVI